MNVDDGNERDHREELYELVWSTPMTKVAEKFEVSGSYLARVCTELRVPRPERGYWAKLAVGKAPQRPALPEPLPGDPVVWSWTDELPAPAMPKPRPAPAPAFHGRFPASQCSPPSRLMADLGGTALPNFAKASNLPA